MSPGCIKVSPGGACVVLNFSDSERRHPVRQEKKLGINQQRYSSTCQENIVLQRIGVGGEGGITEPQG